MKTKKKQKSIKSTGTVHNRKNKEDLIQKINQTQNSNPYIGKKFIQMNHQKKFNQIKMKLLQFFGKNYVISYKKKYGFHQQWQIKHNYLQKKIEPLGSINYTTILPILIIIVINIVFVWYRNIQFFCSFPKKYHVQFPIYEVVLISQILDAVVKYLNIQNQESGIQKKQILLLIYKNILCSIFLIICFLGINKDLCIQWSIYQIFSIYLFFERASELYQSLRLKNIVLMYEHQFKIFDLIFSLIMYAHFFAILLYLGSLNNPDNNWVTKLSIQNQNQFQIYTYALYFTTTTILTVGYGDIVPTNITQIIVVIIVQIMGIVNFAYIINEIGYTMSELRKSRQVLQRDLLTIQKMRHCYKMQDDLVEKSRIFLINQNDSKINKLVPQQQNKIMMKFNQDLRNNISRQNSLAVVNSSIFFLCRWSKNFKNSIASKLIHSLLSPEQQVYQPLGKQRLYIIKNGKIEYQIGRKGNKKCFSNGLRTLQTNQNTLVCDNAYGYSFLISSLPIHLKAIAKQATTCYYIEKQPFLSIVQENILDFQYFHELKHKIQSLQLPESIQCPNIYNVRQHFNPTKAHLIRVYKSKNKNITQNRKQQYHRRDKSVYLNLVGIQMIQKLNSLRQKSSEDIMVQETISQKDFSIKNIPQTDPYTARLSLLRSNFQCDSEELLLTMFSQDKFAHFFQQGKNYSNYYKQGNQVYILKRLQTSNYAKKQIQNDIFLNNYSTATAKQFGHYLSINIENSIR